MQTQGPFATWWHEHRVVRDGTGSRVEDTVYFKAPLGPLGWLAERLFARAVVLLPAAALCGDAAAAEVEQALTSLHELVQRRGAVAADPAAFWTAVGRVAEMDGTHPSLRGLALVLLELGGHLEPGDLAARLRFWLSATVEAKDKNQIDLELKPQPPAVHQGAHLNPPTEQRFALAMPPE